MADQAAARRDELAARLRDLEARVGAACAAAGRDRSDITLVAITKTFPATDVQLLSGLGVTDVGENRDQEAAAKVAECARLGVPRLRWHFVGQLQTNKARSVASYADVVHSVDRVRLVQALDRAAGDRGRVLDCLVQVDLDSVDSVDTVDGVDSEGGAARGRGGIVPSAAGEVCAALDAAEHLRLAGLMAVAPLDGDAGDAFARLATLAGRLRASYPPLTVVSAGMSGDLEAAIAHGATHLRVGRALLGSRPPLG
ncbi:MAG: YggS family pyridoxal phosphate-dependent enzyme [Actinomycetes bacterium]